MIARFFRVVGFVDAEVVDAELFEVGAVVLAGSVEQFLRFGFEFEDAQLDVFHGARLGGPVAGTQVARSLGGARSTWASMKRASVAGSSGIRSNTDSVIDDRVPVADRGPGDELFASGRALLGCGREQHLGCRVQGAPFGAELFLHVVRDDHHGFVDHPEPFQFHRRDHHRGGLASTDVMREQHRRLRQNARHRRALMSAWGEGVNEARQRQVAAVVAAWHRRC